MPSLKRQVEYYLKAHLGLLRPSAGSFEKLPVELVELIATFLDDDALFTFRTTCRYIARCTHFYFVRTHLAVLCTDLSTRSFNRLENLAADPDMVRHVETLVVKQQKQISTWTKPSERPKKRTRWRGPRIGNGLVWKRLESGLLDLDQEAVLAWHRMLRRLVKCRAFRVSTGVFRSTGEEPGYKPVRTPGNGLSGSEALAIILQLIPTCATTTTGNGISLSLWLVDFDPGLLPVDAWLTDPDRNRCALARSLFLSHIPASLPAVGSLILRGTPGLTTYRKEEVSSLRYLLSASPGLRKIEVSRVALDFISEAIASCNSDSEIRGALKLEEITFDGVSNLMEDKEQSFRQFLRDQQPFLKKLALSRVGLYNWPAFFETLDSEASSALQHLSVARCRQRLDVLSYNGITWRVPARISSIERNAPDNTTFTAETTSTESGKAYIAFSCSGPQAAALMRMLTGEMIVDPERQVEQTDFLRLLRLVG
ncbi:hypothetical protein BJY00DRAFT_312121 [Aspergillus carlsbadensis]|nr:hypothetical protein BJY00DRAFT_312121 [Aspergillus carlsbadensis]